MFLLDDGVVPATVTGDIGEAVLMAVLVVMFVPRVLGMTVEAGLEDRLEMTGLATRELAGLEADEDSQR